MKKTMLMMLVVLGLVSTTTTVFAKDLFCRDMQKLDRPIIICSCKNPAPAINAGDVPPGYRLVSVVLDSNAGGSGNGTFYFYFAKDETAQK